MNDDVGKVKELFEEEVTLHFVKSFCGRRRGILLPVGERISRRPRN